jgi:Hydrolase of X-linked nucleoside diphosphate N terminal.
MNEQLLSSQRKMLALIQSGLSFTKDPFDKDRYQKLEQILLQQIADNSNENLQVLTDIIANDHGYITPKVDVRAFIRKNNKFLLVQDIKTRLGLYRADLPTLAILQVRILFVKLKKRPV